MLKVIAVKITKKDENKKDLYDRKSIPSKEKQSLQENIAKDKKVIPDPIDDRKFQK